MSREGHPGKADFDAMRRDTEALLVGAEKEESLAALDELERAAEEGDRLIAEMRARQAKERMQRRMIALLLTLPIACVPSWLAISLILDFASGRLDPVVFAVEFGLASITAAVFLYTGLVPLFTGEDASVYITGKPR